MTEMSVCRDVCGRLADDDLLRHQNGRRRFVALHNGAGALH